MSAGKGIRLRPLTSRIPKCLLEINGITILENCLQNLKKAGVNKIIIVVGHLKEVIIDKIGFCFDGIPIEYIVSENYETTNNIVSLWCARHEFTEDLFLIESDIFFGSELLQNIKNSPNNVAVVDEYKNGMNGTVFIDNKMILDYHEQNLNNNVYKTVNIYFLKKNTLNRISSFLNNYIDAGHTDQYYETVFSDLIDFNWDKFQPYVYKNWAEVDDIEDLNKARYKFSSIEKKYEIVSNLHGYFWPYEIIDYCHLYNMYFPPKQMINYFHTHLDKLVTTYPSGHKELAYYLSEWLNISPEQLVIGNGASELIRLLGGNFCISTPSFNEFENSPSMVRVPLNEETWAFDCLKFLDALNGSQCDYGVIVTPNNPTSIAVSNEDIQYVLNNTNKKIIVDESFGDFCGQSFLTWLKQFPNLLVLKSLGKAFGICGLRLGFLAGDVEKIRKKLPIWNINNFAETFLRQISRYEKQFKQSIEKTKQDREKLYNNLCRNDKLQTWKPDGNFIFCKILNMSGDKVARNLFEKNIFIKHCGGKTMKNGNQYLRIGCRTERENEHLCQSLDLIFST